MRGVDHQQSQIFSYLSPEIRVRKDHPLRAIRLMVDKVLVEQTPGTKPVTLGGDKGYDTADFLAECRHIGSHPTWQRRENI